MKYLSEGDTANHWWKWHRNLNFFLAAEIVLLIMTPFSHIVNHISNFCLLCFPFLQFQNLLWSMPLLTDKSSDFKLREAEWDRTVTMSLGKGCRKDVGGGQRSLSSVCSWKYYCLFLYCGLVSSSGASRLSLAFLRGRVLMVRNSTVVTVAYVIGNHLLQTDGQEANSMIFHSQLFLKLLKTFF